MKTIAAGRDRFRVEMTQDEIMESAGCSSEFGDVWQRHNGAREIKVGTELISISHQRIAFPQEVISEIDDLFGIPDCAADDETSVVHILVCWLHTATERKQLLSRLIGVRLQRLFELSYGHRACQIYLLLKCFENGIGQRVSQPFNLLRKFPYPTPALMPRCSREPPSIDEMRTETSNGLRRFFGAVSNGTGPLQLNPHCIPVVPASLLDLFGHIGERRKGDDHPYQPTQCRYPFTQAQFIWSAQGFIGEHTNGQNHAEEHAHGYRYNPAHPVSRRVLRTSHFFAPAKSGRRLFREPWKRNAAPPPQTREVGS